MTEGYAPISETGLGGAVPAGCIEGYPPAIDDLVVLRCMLRMGSDLQLARLEKLRQYAHALEGLIDWWPLPSGGAPPR
ncbi:hypothetical protein [Streptomyces sp. NPDC093544]|uniref:hypothetical protein n=1 Tax=Streptomyces sp. NPDC093544 TaxID=3155200 RepID=UPI0034190B59